MSFGDLKVQDLIYEDSSNNEITVVIADLATKANPTFTGTVTVPTANANDNTTKAASTAYVQTELGDYLTTATASSTYAPKAAPAFTGTATGVNLTLSGNLTVNGTQTIINTQTLDVEDKQIEIGKVSSPSDTTANEGGIKLKGASDKTILWYDSTDAWTFNQNIEIASSTPSIKLKDGNGRNVEIIGGSASTGPEIRTAYTADLRFGTNSLERMRINSSGLILVGHHTNVADSRLQVIGVDENTSSQSLLRFSNSASSSVLNFYKSRNAGAGVNTVVQNNDTVGVIRFKGADGTDYSQVADMQAAIDGTPGNNDTPGRLMFSTTADGAQYTSERLRISSTGAFGIAGANYGSSGQVLTSGGSGAAPSWAAVPAGGNTFTAVANGSIANNKAVMIDTDGKVSEVKTTTGARTTAMSVPASPIALTISEDNEYIKVVNCGEDKVLGIWQKTNGTWQINSAVGYHSGSNPYASWGIEEHIIANAGSIRMGVPDAVYIGNNKVIIAFQYDDDIKLYMGTITPSNNRVTWGAALTLSTNANAHSPSLSYDPDNDSVLLCYSGGSNSGLAVVITWSGTTLSAGSYVDFPRISSNVGIGVKTATYDTNDNKHIVAFRYDDYGNRGYVVSVSVSGTTPTFGSLVQFCGTGTSTDNLGNNLIDIAFDDNVNKFVIFYTAGVRCWKHVGSCSSGTISITPSDQSMSIYTNGNTNIFPSLVFEPIGKVFVAMAVSSAGGNFNKYAQYALFSLNSNGTYNINVSSPNIISNATKYTSVAHYGKTTEGIVVLVYQDISQNSGSRVAESQDGITTQTVSTLTDPNRYVGYADQAYTNGQTATIKTYGNVVDTLSGLTTGTKYYVQGDGTLGTSWDNTVFPTDGSWYANTPLAGLAISASKLIIRDPYGMHHT